MCCKSAGSLRGSSSREHALAMFPDVLSIGDKGFGDELLWGAAVTLEVAVYAVLFGLVMGLAAAGAKLGGALPLRWLAEAYTILIRGIPELLIVMLVYFGGSRAVQGALSHFGVEGAVEISKTGAGAFALGLIFGAFASEVFRGAYLAVPKGQIEAALACGMSRSQVFRRVRFPQMLRIALPGLGNLWMVTLKDTSLVSVIALDELQREASVAGEASGQPFPVILAALIIYLLLTLVSDIFRARLERYASRGVAQG